MVTKRIRSEYMKKFKDPKWETYTKCYEEMLKYRLTRRLLEHTHNPWFWAGSDTDSDSGGRSPPPPTKNQVRCETSRDRTEAELEECEGARMDRNAGPVPRLPLQEEEENVSARQSAVHGSQLEGAGETRGPEEEREEQRASSRGSKQLSVPHREQNRERDTGEPQQSKPKKSSKQTWRSQRVRPAPTQQPREDVKDSRHPFALYGSGEKDADIAGRKTHNVGPAASTNEIHESALRAKMRREVERQIQTQKTERRRAKSADLDKARKVVPPEFNPWLTEYMRCFSARSR
ncbi:centriole, cilia and spindle-associated protein [Micropterus salmoides]|uniref:centriole, cilia and spindle-associated protein n=1 Tax=Micropterus salmoides TaxID=27706 RepID=UPI0018EC3532|nr:centriole, cilia and spindle-associated protein [Micropterus salmoides]XP_038557064.1 centriole, cilia and spindle-associated protein [Micropterus salmoides]XP_038557065.1 centriole, cilia and spindle-associated protein [Micropterus salmoides]XP_038557066.1 centriole, cilia and spindle-associated protein [Micropterus salmoides]XP_038557067.1 centriole, cilia and spindle-associated protein [Micropterus salmoides]